MSGGTPSNTSTWCFRPAAGCRREGHVERAELALLNWVGPSSCEASKPSASPLTGGSWASGCGEPS